MNAPDAQQLARDGYLIVRKVAEESSLRQWREEADAVARAAGTTCVRHLRRRSAVFDELALSSRFCSLLPAGYRPVRSILFDKTPEENWPVAWHQDLTICVAARHEWEGYGPWSTKDGVVHVQPPMSLLEHMLTLRLHLDDTPASNGALRIVPGSHRAGRLSPEEIAQATESEALVCECEAGDVLVMCPLLLHASSRSSAPARRRVIHIEYARDADLPPPLSWHE